jgi:fatty acid desaturase
LRVIFLVAGVLGLVFGGADQYLGSLFVLGPWTSTVSGVSASWLVLPFAVGATQKRQRQAMLAALTAVMCALAGYFAMTLSPFESVPLSRFPSDLIHLVPSQLANIVGGLVTAPLFGLLGQRWRTERSWISAAALAATVCLEPLARIAVGRLSSPGLVWLIEISLGVCLAGYFARTGLTYRRGLRTFP